MSDAEASAWIIVGVCACGTVLLCVRYYFQFRYHMRELELERVGSGHKVSTEPASVNAQER